jgi:hypothetical protein
MNMQVRRLPRLAYRTGDVELRWHSKGHMAAKSSENELNVTGCCCNDCGKHSKLLLTCC